MAIMREAAMNGVGETLLDDLVVAAHHRLEWRDHVADHILRRVVQQDDEALADGELRLQQAGDILDDKAVLGHGAGVVAEGLAVPSGDAGEAVGDVGYLDVERGWIEKIEPPSRQHALPCTGGRAGFIGHVCQSSGFDASGFWVSGQP